MSSISSSIILSFAALSVSSVAAAQVSPEVRVGARGVMSMDQVFRHLQSNLSVVDFSDSALLLGFREKLYSDARGGFSLGLQFPDADSDLGQVYFHRVALSVEGQRDTITVGRARAATSLIEFPTLRDDDALAFTDTRNPLSYGLNTEDSPFANVVEVSHVFAQRLWLRAHGEHFRAPRALSGPETSFGLNSVGAAVEYRVPEAQRWERRVVQQVGLGASTWQLGEDWGDSSEPMPVFTGSFVLNVHPDPVHFIDLRHQTHYTLGTGPVDAPWSYRGETQATSISTFTSLGYAWRPLEQPRLRASVGVGYRVLPEQGAPTSELKTVTNVFWRIGDQFDVGAQGQARHATGDLSGFRDDELQVQLVMSFAVDQIFNQQFDDRGSILNLEHGYLP